MSGLRSTLIAGLAATAITGAQAEGSQDVTPRLSSPAVATATQEATQALMTQVWQPILLAQAQETDGKIYTADIPQIDKTIKRIVYYRDKQGVIIPPPIENGKLIDGSPAPEHPLRALIAQKKILVPYDKNAQFALAMVGDKDLIRESTLNLKDFSEKVEAWKPITKSDLELYLFHSYIAIESWWKWDGLLKLAEFVSTTRLKLTSVEYNSIRTNAQDRAKQIWKSATGALA